MMEQPLLSVIIPVYNTKEYLPRCIESVMHQSYSNLEIICVDDGSIDGSGVILDEYLERDNRIKVIHKSNGGLVSARKAGLELASGMFVAYVDSDDWIEKDMYSELISAMLETNAQIAASGFIRDYGSHVINDNEKVPQAVYYGENLKAEIIDKLVDYEHPFYFLISSSLCNKVFESTFLRDYQMEVPKEVTINEDMVVTIPMICNIDRLYVSKGCFYHYCSRNDSMLNDKNKDETGAINRAYAYVRNRIKRPLADYYELYTRLLMCPETVLGDEQGQLRYYGSISKTDRIIVYGAGTFGKSLVKYLREHEYNIVAWADKSGDGETIIRPEQIASIDYDLILIGVLLRPITENIVQNLQSQGESKERIRVFQK